MYWKKAIKVLDDGLDNDRLVYYRFINTSHLLSMKFIKSVIMHLMPMATQTSHLRDD